MKYYFIYAKCRGLKGEKWALKRRMPLRNPINPQEAWQDIWVLGCWRRITTQISGRAVRQSCQRVMKKNPSNDKFGFIKVMLSWQEPCFQLALNSPYFITDIFFWPTEWAKYEMKRGEKVEWSSVSLCNSSSAITFSSSSQAVRNQEHLQTLWGKTLFLQELKQKSRSVWEKFWERHYFGFQHLLSSIKMKRTQNNKVLLLEVTLWHNYLNKFIQPLRNWEALYSSVEFSTKRYLYSFVEWTYISHFWCAVELKGYFSIRFQLREVPSSVSFLDMVMPTKYANKRHSQL